MYENLQLNEENVIPDLAPHIDNPMEFEFIEDIHRKQYLKSLFTESFYEPNCDGKSNFMVNSWMSSQKTEGCTVWNFLLTEVISSI